MADIKGGASSAKNFSEAWLSLVWQYKLISEQGLTTCDGKSVKIIYPGRRSREAGPDFYRAIISFDGELLRGDVELHLYSSYWLSHRHHLDPAYNRLILQVVMWHDSKIPTSLENGVKVPVLALDGKVRKVQYLPARQLIEPCPLRLKYGSGLIRMLERAGEERFSGKATVFSRDIQASGPEQAFYKGLMRALGYSQNKEQFQHLAMEVPQVELIRAARSNQNIPASLVIQAYLLGSAGLLTEQRGAHPAEDEFIDHLSNIWSLLGRPRAEIADGLRWRGIRPENWPTRRLAGASYLITEKQPRGLWQKVLDDISKQNPELANLYVVPARDYWSEHYDFGVAGARGLPLIGRGRASEIAVNITLPFIHAWGKASNRPQLAFTARQIYKKHAGLTQNRITRLMREILFPRGLPGLKSACRQQGLLHLYHSFCFEKKCDSCCEWAGGSSQPL